jgi:hypothetical protein
VQAQWTWAARPLAGWQGSIEHCDGGVAVAVAVAVAGIHGNDGLDWHGNPQAAFREIDHVVVVVVACGWDVAVASLVAEDSTAFARARQCRERAAACSVDRLDTVLAAVAAAIGAVEHSQTFP